MLAYSADVPMNWAGAYVASPTAPVTDWAIRVGATALTSGLADLSRRASTSFMVRSVVRLIVPVRDRPPAAGPKPPWRFTIRVLVPRLWICFWTATEEPLPTATRRITAPTPIRMPSMVSAERRPLPRMARTAIFMLSAVLTPALRGEPRRRHRGRRTGAAARGPALGGGPR